MLAAAFEWFLRQFGIAGVIVAGLLAFYEGLPGLNRIPFLDRVPMIGDIAVGRVRSYAAERVAAATKGMVAKVELAVKEAEVTSLQAQLAEEARRRKAAQEAYAAANARARETAEARDKAQAALEDRIAADTGQDGCRWTEEDLKWLGRR